MSKKPRVLVVDDDPIVGRGISEELKLSGFETEVFTDGRKAAYALKKRCFDMALVDLWMPGCDGVETCRLLKEQCPDLQVVLMSARPDNFAGRKEEFIKAGGLNFFLYKPFEEDDLVVRTIKKILKFKKR